MRIKMLACVVVLSLAVFQWAIVEAAPGLQKISEHVYAYVDVKNASPAGNSFGANAGLVVGSNAALVIDTLVSAKEADRLLSDIRKITDKPVKYVVNTHYHLDHAWGNCGFAKLGAVVIGHQNALKHVTEAAKSLEHPENFGLSAKDLQGTTVQAPTISFRNSMTIDLGGVTVNLQYLGPTHTDDSITAYVPQDKVLFAGDVLFTHYHPFLAEGDLENWDKVLTELEKTPATKIIPGHGPISSTSDLKEMKTYLRAFDEQARALCAGKAPKDAQTIATELIKRLPDQQRTELPSLVVFNLQLKYLAPKEAKK